MTTALTTGDRRYAAFLDKFKEHLHRYDVSALLNFHELGGLVVEFFSGLTEKKYGSASMARLAEDVKAMGLLPHINQVEHYLYSAKVVHTRWKKEELVELGKLGFTQTHAKELARYEDPDLLAQISSKMIVDGKVVSTRELADIVRDLRHKAIGSAAKEAVIEATAERVDAKAEPEARVLFASEDTVIDATAEVVPDEPTEKVAEGKPEHRAAPTIRERTVQEPLKVLRAFEKALVSAQDNVPNVFIVMKEMNNCPSSAKMDKAYLTLLRSIRGLLRQLTGESFPELLRNVDSELDAAATT